MNTAYNSPMSLDTLKPSQLLALALFGLLLECVPFAIPGPRTHHDSVLWMILAIALLGCGLFLLLKSTKALKGGIQNGKWHATQIEPLRAIVESPWIKLLLFIFFGAFVLLMLSGKHRYHSIAWAIYVPLMASTQISSAFIRPTKQKSRVDWHTFPPLTSNHWGEK
jgi:hypothetical protein